MHNSQNFKPTIFPYDGRQNHDALVLGFSCFLGIGGLDAVNNRRRADTFFTDASVGLHLGWVSLATVANITAWLTADGPVEWESAGTTLGVIVLVVVGLIGLAIAWISRWRVAPGLALAWGLSWLAYNRLELSPHDAAIGVTAAIVALAVSIVPIVGSIAHHTIAIRNAEA